MDELVGDVEHGALVEVGPRHAVDEAEPPAKNPAAVIGGRIAEPLPDALVGRLRVFRLNGYRDVRGITIKSVNERSRGRPGRARRTRTRGRIWTRIDAQRLAHSGERGLRLSPEVYEGDDGARGESSAEFGTLASSVWKSSTGVEPHRT